jgi:hypothetical protein
MYHPKLIEGSMSRISVRYRTAHAPDNGNDKDLDTGLYYTCATPSKVVMWSH